MEPHDPLFPAVVVAVDCGMVATVNNNHGRGLCVLAGEENEMTCENCGKHIEYTEKLIQIMFFDKTNRLDTINLCHACRLSASEVIVRKEKETP